MATGRVPTTANSPLTAKGDLFGYSTTQARVPVGNNGETLVADSSATTGLRWTATPSASNPVLNSAMQIAQRGTSFSLSTAMYTLDRWYANSALNTTVSQQTTNDTTNLPFIQRCLRIQRTAGATTTSDFVISQSLETVNSIPYVGKTVTLSLYARAGANYSATSNFLGIRIWSGTGTDQNLVGYTGSAIPLNGSGTLTTTWQRFSVTGTIATSATEIGVQVYATPTGTAGAADFFEITGVQIDVGSVALPFRTYSATLAGELQAAQRYYQRFTCGGAAGRLVMGMNDATTTSALMMNLPVTMRSTPPTLDFGNVQITEPGNNNFALTGLTVSSLSTNTQMHLAATGLTGLTLYRPCYLTGTGSTSYIAFSAEL